MSDTHAQTVPYVRELMLAEQDAPLTEKGAIRWLRHNLFSSWLNAILTLVAIWVIWTVLSAIVPWMYRGIWDAGSLTACREIEVQRYGANVEAACWSVLRERWTQLLFGFYPQEAYWRPVAALVVLLVGVAPVLFPRMAGRFTALTPLTPFLCYWILWGGTIWGPLLVAAGFGLMVVVFRYGQSLLGSMGAILAAVVVTILYWFFVVGPLAGELSRVAPIGLRPVASKEFGGFMLSIIIGIAGISLSFPIGIILALGRQSDLFIINKMSVIFIEVIRGVPLIVWLFTASLLLNYFLPPGTNFDLMLRVIIMVTLFSSAYIAEVIRGGLAALPKGQYEGADSLGLDYWQSMRLIILPQALKIAIPGIVNTFIGLFKDTTLVVFIGLLDPIGLTNSIRASTDWNGIYWELFIFIGLLFFICCFSMSRYSQFLERKLRTDHR